MNKLKQRKQQSAALKQVEKKNSRIYFIYILICFVCGIYSYRTYNHIVFIPFELTVSIFLFFGIVAAILTIKFKKEVLKKDFNLFKEFFLSINGFGSIGLSLFFLINNTFSDDELFIKNFKICATHEELKHTPNSIDIQFKGNIKNIVLPDNSIMEIDKSDFIKLKLKRGFFGYFIILDKQLI